MKNKTNLLLVSLTTIFIALGCSDSKNAPAVANTATSPAGAPTSAPKADEKPVVINAVQLSKDYEENELAADDKFKGKTLEVSGKISNIAETLGNVTVSLEGMDFMKTVMCSFPEAEKANVVKLKKGQKVTLIGTGDGKTSVLYVGLKECRVKN